MRRAGRIGGNDPISRQPARCDKAMRPRRSHWLKIPHGAVLLLIVRTITPEAVKALEQANGADAQYNLGNALAKLGHYPEAIKAYDRALQDDPHNEDARANRKMVEEAMRKSPQRSSSSQQQPSGGGQGNQDNQNGQNGRSGQSSAQGQDGQNQGQQRDQSGQQQGNDTSSGQRSNNGNESQQGGQGAK